MSSHRINKLLRREGSVWQKDRFDRIIRNRREFDGVFEYIAWNPFFQGLASLEGEYEFTFLGAEW